MAPIDYAYDVIIGVSIGAISAAVLAIHEIGDEKIAVEFLAKLFVNLKL